MYKSCAETPKIIFADVSTNSVLCYSLSWFVWWQAPDVEACRSTDLPSNPENRCLVFETNVLGHKAGFKMLCIRVNNLAVSSLSSSRDWSWVPFGPVAFLLFREIPFVHALQKGSSRGASPASSALQADDKNSFCLPDRALASLSALSVSSSSIGLRLLTGLLFQISVRDDFLLLFFFFLSCILFGESSHAYDLFCFGFNVFGRNFSFSKHYFFLLVTCLIHAI